MLLHVLCILCCILNHSWVAFMIYKAVSSLVTAISGTICLTTCKTNRLHRSWKRDMTSVSLGKTISRFKIKPAIQNFITACQAYCSYPLKPHRLVFPCLWQTWLSAFSIAKMFADSLINTKVSSKEQKMKLLSLPSWFSTLANEEQHFWPSLLLIHDCLFTCFIFLHWFFCDNCAFSFKLLEKL